VRVRAGSVSQLNINLTVIWIMTIVLYVLLYFDVFKRLVHGFETRRKYRKAI
jgi:hypothetical protein